MCVYIYIYIYSKNEAPKQLELVAAPPVAGRATVGEVPLRLY